MLETGSAIDAWINNVSNILSLLRKIVTPAKAGAGVQKTLEAAWIPAPSTSLRTSFAGMTFLVCLCGNVPLDIQSSIVSGVSVRGYEFCKIAG